MKKLMLFLIALLAAFAVAIPAYAATANNAKDEAKADARTAATAFMEAWKTKDARGFCGALSAAFLQNTGVTLKECVATLKKNFRTNSSLRTDAYRIVQIAVFREGNEAFVDVRITAPKQNRAKLYLWLIKEGPGYKVSTWF